MTRPIGIDLFAGAGGLSLGFEQAGFDVAAAVEIDPIHAAVHSFNFPNCCTLPRTVVGLSGTEIRKAAGVGSRSVDVVFGGAPCQGFSLIGQRALDDPRNQLVKDFVRLVAELEAKHFVFENVKGLTLGRQRTFLEELIEAFSKNGYVLRAPWQVLNAAHFGVPQHRERLFLIGTKKGLDIPEYPLPFTRPADTHRPDRPAGPTCEDAIGDLPEPEVFSQLLFADWVHTDDWGEPSDYARGLRCVDEFGWGYGFRRHWQPNMLTSSARTNHTDTSRRRFEKAPPGATESGSRLFKLARHGVANTLRAGTDSARGAFTSPRPIHYDKPRCVTVREMARLHGFPDWFRFHVTKWHGARQIGNSVPPPLAKAVAQQIIRALGAVPAAPTGVLKLGNTKLLSLDMTHAARYWGVPVPIAQRIRNTSDHSKQRAAKSSQKDLAERRGAPLEERLSVG